MASAAWESVQRTTDAFSRQGCVGSQLRLRLRDPEAGLFSRMLASRQASASKYSKVVDLGLLKCCF